MRAQLRGQVQALWSAWAADPRRHLRSGEELGRTDWAGTFALFEKITAKITAAMTPRNRWSWRLQQLMYRTNYDMFVYTRSAVEKAGEAEALADLRGSFGTVPSRIAAAESSIAAAMAASKEQTADLWVRPQRLVSVSLSLHFRDANCCCFSVAQLSRCSEHRSRCGSGPRRCSSRFTSSSPSRSMAASTRGAAATSTSPRSRWRRAT